jgi:hypothetical protein
MTDDDPYSPPAAGPGSVLRRSPPSSIAIAFASAAVFLLAILSGGSIGLALGAVNGENRRPLAMSEEKADIHASVDRIVGTVLGSLFGCGTGVGLVVMFYWHRARIHRKLTNAPQNSPERSG